MLAVFCGLNVLYVYTLVRRINGSKVSEDSYKDIVDQDLHILCGTVITPTVNYSGVYSYEFTEFELFMNEIEETVKPYTY